MPVCTAAAQPADLGEDSPPCLRLPACDSQPRRSDAVGSGVKGSSVCYCCPDAEVDLSPSPRPACPAFFCLDRSRMSEALPSSLRAPFGHSASALALGLGWSSRGARGAGCWAGEPEPVARTSFFAQEKRKESFFPKLVRKRAAKGLRGSLCVHF